MQSIPILRTKLFIPKPLSELVDRQRLVSRMVESSGCRLVLLTAPAGSGKTTLLSTWIAQNQMLAAWVSLDERDNDMQRFWGYVIAALRTIKPDIGQTPQAMLQSPQPPSLDTVLTALLNEIDAIQQDFYLVLDDYHVITNQDIHQGVSYLIENMPPQMHLGVASRTEPPFSLPLLRVRRAILELNPADLRFSHDETAAFLNQVMQLNLTADNIAILENRTEGWIAGLQLAALSLQDIDDISSFIQGFSGSYRYVFDYLAQEVLKKQPDELQSFLLQTSILDRLTAPMCDYLLKRRGSQDILDRLENAQLFLIPLDHQRGWYRYHHLFAEFLRARLAQTASPEHISALHKRASDWLEKNNLIYEAIDQSLLAVDYTGAAHLISSVAQAMFNNSELVPLLEWMDRLPQEFYIQNTDLSIARAWALLATSQRTEVERYLHFAELSLGLPADGSPGFDARLSLPLAEIACIRSNLAFHQVDLDLVLEHAKYAQHYLASAEDRGYIHSVESLEAVVSFNRALVSEFRGDVSDAVDAFQQTIDLSRASSNPHLLALSTSHLTHLQILQGRLRQAADILQQTLAESGKDAAPPSVLSGTLLVSLGNIYYEWNDLDLARQYLERGIEQGKLWANLETLLPGIIGLARIWYAAGNLELAISLHDELEEVARRQLNASGMNLAEAERAWLWIRSGQTEPALNWLQNYPLAPDTQFAYLDEENGVYLARILVALGRYQDGLALVDRLAETVEAGGRFGRLIELHIIQAMAHRAIGKSDQAVSSLTAALALAEPEGYLRTFIDAGSDLMALLADVKAPHRDYAARIMKSSAAAHIQARIPKDHPSSTSPSLLLSGGIEPLSERELEVLQLIARGYTNQQIAETLVISTNTVKSHVKNILGRLQVSNRTQAVRRAQELGLL